MAVHIRTKIIVSFAIILALLSFISFVVYHNRNILFHGMHELEGQVREINGIAGMRLNIGRVVMPPNDYLITGDIKEKDKFLRISAAVEKDLAWLIGLRHEGHAGFDRGALEKYALLKDKAFEIFAIGNPVGNKKGMLLMKELDEMSEDIITNHLDKSHEVISQEAATVASHAKQLRIKVDSLIAAGAVVSLIAVAALITYLSKSIIRPILMFRDGANIIGKGNLDHKINLRDGVEMNLLAEEFNRMTGKLKESYAGLEKKVEERTKELNEANMKLQELSITDGLTGVYNHRYFYEKLSEEIRRAERYGHPLSLIMADIDFFKQYNDAYGHVEGDKGLEAIASFMKQSVRAGDMVARYGGEEFSVILPETGKKEAMAVAERIRLCVQAAHYASKNGESGGRLTVSLGVAAFPEDAEDQKGLIEKADAALYRAKEKGRNRVDA